MRRGLPLLILAIVALGSVEMKDVCFRGFTRKDIVVESAIAKLENYLTDEELIRAEKFIHPLGDVNFILAWSRASKSDSLMRRVKKIRESKFSIIDCIKGMPVTDQMKEASSMILSLPGLAKSCSSESEKIMAMLYRALRADAHINSPRCLLGIYVDHAREWGKLCIKTREQVQWPAKFDDLWDRTLHRTLEGEVSLFTKEQNIAVRELRYGLEKINNNLGEAGSTDVEILMRKISEINESPESIATHSHGEGRMHEQADSVKRAINLMLSLPEVAKSCGSKSLGTLAMLYSALEENNGDGCLSGRIYTHYARQWGKRCIKEEDPFPLPSM